MSRPGASHAAALDPYLAGLVAYATIIGLSGRPGWRNALWLAVGVYALVHLVDLDTTVLSFLITLLVGRTIGLGVRYVAGSPSLRPSAAEIATALNSADRKVTEMARLRSAPRIPDRAGSRHYAATTSAGDRLDVTVYDKDQQAAGAVYRLYRSVLLRGQVSRGAPQSADRTVERRALLTYAAEDAGAPTPRLRAVVRVGPEATVLAFDHHEGTTLAERKPGVTDAELRNIWDAVQQLHEHRVTHRSLTADRILLTSDDQVMLLDLGDGDVAASDLQVRLDVAQLLAELALYVGPERAADLALAKAGADELVAVVPLLQRAALARSTRAALRRRRDVLPALRQRLLAAVPGGEVAPVRLRADPAPQPGHAGRDRRRGVPARGRARAGQPRPRHAGRGLALGPDRAGPIGRHLRRRGAGAVRIRGRAAELHPYPAGPAGRVLRHAGHARRRRRRRGQHSLPAAPQDPGAGRGGQRRRGPGRGPRPAHPDADRVRRDRRSRRQARVPPADLGLLRAGRAGRGGRGRAGLPAGRRLLRARLAPTLGQVLPRLLEIAQQPRKLAEGIGGALLLTVAYILCLAACVKAFHGSAAFAGIAVVYLTGSALGSIIPTPGGLGAVEAALTAGLVATGLHGTEAASAVLLFRLLTFWLPVPFGWVALNYLERKDAI